MPTPGPAGTPDEGAPQALRRIARERWRRAVALTIAMLVVYFGFIALTAYAKGLMGSLVAPGLSVGILLGALVIVAAFALTGVYVRWANARYDPALRAIKARLEADDARDAGRGPS